MESNFVNKTIWTGNGPEVMRGMNSESMDLVYLDPSFNSKANYAAPIGSKAAGAVFKDAWSLSDVDVKWINLIEAKHAALHCVLLAAMTDRDKSYLACMAIRMWKCAAFSRPPIASIYTAIFVWIMQLNQERSQYGLSQNEIAALDQGKKEMASNDKPPQPPVPKPVNEPSRPKPPPPPPTPDDMNPVKRGN